jgi:hypothetical protein
VSWSALALNEDYDYSAEELEFLRAMDGYIRESGNQFPTWSEALKVLRSLGYEKRNAIPIPEDPSPDYSSPDCRPIRDRRRPPDPAGPNAGHAGRRC